MTPDSTSSNGDRSRRRVLAGIAAGGVAGLTGRVGGLSDDALARQDGNATPSETTATQGRFFPRGPRVGVRKVADGPLQQPVSLKRAVEVPVRRFVADQTGLVYVHGPDGLRQTPFLDVRDRTVDVPDNYTEKGLLGLAFHPEFRTNRRFYVTYSAPPREDGEYVGPEGRTVPSRVNHTSVLAEYRATENRRSANPDSERILLEIPQPQYNHNGGAITFGPEGYLYVTVGDGGSEGDVGSGHVDDWYDANDGGNGQDVTRNLLGSVLRIDVDRREGGNPYAVPDNNPLVGTDGLDEQFAWGFRNPWRLTMNDGEPIVADVGQSLFEEVDVVRKGGNYGWNVREGTRCFDPNSPENPPERCPSSTPPSVRGGEQFQSPVVEYPHSHDGQQVGNAAVGGHVYRGSAIPALTGEYVFGDWSRSWEDPLGRLLAARPQIGDEQWSTRELVVANSPNGELNRFVLAFGRTPDGRLYVLTSETRLPTGNGSVYEIVPPSEGERIEPP